MITSSTQFSFVWLFGPGSDYESSRSVEDYRFSTELAVRFSETDAQGIAKNLEVYLN